MYMYRGPRLTRARLSWHICPECKLVSGLNRLVYQAGSANFVRIISMSALSVVRIKRGLLYILFVVIG